MRRSVMLVAAAVLGAAASVVTSVAAAVPAQAAPIPVNFNNVTGTTHLAKPNVDVAVPTSVVQTQVDLDAKTLTGSAALAPLTAKLNLAHLIGVTSTVRVVPTGPLTGTIDLAASRLTTTTTFTLEVTNVHLDAAPAINLVPAGCRTSKPTTLTLQNTTPVDIFQPITTQGTYTIPSFTRCGVLTPLLSLLLSGPDNTMTLVLK
ncbi:hypothetical protein GCM10009557_92000 [Virgisporangium ochraceum]|uniref:Uncharacterized protein n=1 Tax=Virgisporangium ochraceum TaxID=65505 RepID=A0A8J3ZW51_9ACTN|nr:hypothetical protein [Virgisporangium ochraceum]GIJ71464.1 hypothetical protein Voc01_063810 [Virgisporangium ochraceum]